MNKKTLILTTLIVHLLGGVAAQQYQQNNIGLNIGIVAAIGTKIDRFGVTINGYYAKNNFQFNSGARFYFNFKNIGPNKQHFEAVGSLGIVYGYGNSTSDSSLFYTPVGNQTQHQNSFGYAYNYYLNNIKTSQQTGTIAIQINEFSLIAENDIFARPKLDRYRTGAFALQYQKKDIALGVNTTLFTGQMGRKIEDPNYPNSYIYKSSEGGNHTKFSNGLLSLQGQYIGKYHQQYQANIGIDAEQVRHVVQNRLIHDMVFLPNAWRKKTNAHIPMLDQEGNQYLFKENQKIRKPSIYLNLYQNSGLFY